MATGGSAPIPVSPHTHRMAGYSGSVGLADGVTVGSNAVVLQGLGVGEGSFVGAGAVVTHTVGNGIVVAGNPARELRRDDS